MTKEQLDHATNLHAHVVHHEQRLNKLSDALGNRYQAKWGDRMVSAFGIHFDAEDVADVIQILIEKEQAALDRAQQAFDALKLTGETGMSSEELRVIMDRSGIMVVN
ncbi:hypothetical protein J2Y45_002133 [Dyadobacter sp. BE34]|uniref:Uncharacterized protein n=1 Tax=Dyadobacter fermentans TaxID=94254 RepID=A0ABU1QWL9_9BACT|nr:MULTISPECIES: hypothetical protein [Dyadobacter]MDR6805558.1 hypothetical protein [Dyadobacter fermentans]MDR7042682.1 hypothetical protein [Dyadobacter sp. BE242]MDR7196994.1 hypothetical protein [Dyadobacter sp. BE34]MDR7215571.1 hypothetical protein [Dyadobacter sp. BE31]MDR7263107.1 hypothetical protein [Dyadobacter sp. BE32]